MTKGKEYYLICDSQANDLAQVREHAMAQEHVGQNSEQIEGRLRNLGHPSQKSVSLREAVALGEANRPLGAYRLDADDPHADVQSLHMLANYSSSDSGEPQRSDTNPEACWAVYDWIMQTDVLGGASPNTRYDKPFPWKNPVRLNMVELAGF